MKKLFKREDILSLPNQLSFLRLALIPLFVWLYLGLGNHMAALITVVFSGFTDVLDGHIARRYNMVTELGKVLDPVADKLTQAALLLCLATDHRSLWAIFALLVIKELTMLVLGCLVLKRTGRVHSARWYGKLCTAVLYGAVCLLLLLPEPSLLLVQGLTRLCAGALLLSLILYIRFDRRLLKQEQKFSWQGPHMVLQ